VGRLETGDLEDLVGQVVTLEPLRSGTVRLSFNLLILLHFKN